MPAAKKPAARKPAAKKQTPSKSAAAKKPAPPKPSWRAPLITAAVVLAACAVALVIALSSLSDEAEDDVSAPTPTTTEAAQPSDDSVSTTDSASAPGS